MANGYGKCRAVDSEAEVNVVLKAMADSYGYGKCLRGLRDRAIGLIC